MPSIVVVLLPVAWVGLHRVLAHPRSRPVARALLGCWVLAALVLPFTPSLAAVQPDGWALPVCFAALMFPVGCAIADLLSAGPMAETADTDRTMHDFAAAMGAAAFVVLFYGSQGIGGRTVLGRRPRCQRHHAWSRRGRDLPDPHHRPQPGGAVASGRSTPSSG